jgi:hypothetical protein
LSDGARAFRDAIVIPGQRQPSTPPEFGSLSEGAAQFARSLKLPA